MKLVCLNSCLLYLFITCSNQHKKEAEEPVYKLSRQENKGNYFLVKLDKNKKKNKTFP